MSDCFAPWCGIDGKYANPGVCNAPGGHAYKSAPTPDRISSLAALTPTEWFDQFREAPDWPEDGQWCARHWAPCPCLGANGMGAAMDLLSVFINEVATATDPAGLNAQMAAAGHLCCTLGDQRMYELWGKWPPVEDPEADAERNHGIRRLPRHTVDGSDA